MSKLKHTYIPLDKATIVDRRHQREVQPPGMVNLENFIPSRSDSSPTLRPDWRYTSDNVYGISSVLTLPETNTIRDALNSVNGLYGSSQVTFFTTYVPYGNDDGTYRVLSGTHSKGTVSGTAGSPIVSGIGTNVLEKAYRGSIMKIPDSSTGSFPGASCLFTETSELTEPGAFYLTKLDTSELTLYGDELVYFEDFTILSGLYKQGGTDEVIKTKYKAWIGDEDSLGWDALYVRANNSSPQNYIGESPYTFLFTTSTNISGSNHKWLTSDNGTNEYYYVKRDGNDPFSSIAVSGVKVDASYVIQTYYYTFQTKQTIREYYIKNTYETLLYDQTQNVIAQTVAGGTLGSLENYQIAYGDNEDGGGLGFNTVYLRDNTSSPDESRSSRSPGSLKLTSYFDTDKSGYKWVPSSITSYWKLVTHADGDAGVPEPDYVTQYYETIEEPGDIVRNKINDDGIIIESGDPGYGYGDFDDDGFDSLYVKASFSFSPETGPYKFRIYFTQYIYGSNYSWVASLGGTNEYYLKQQDGSELAASFDEPIIVSVGGFYDDGTNSTKGTIGSLSDGQWGYGTNAADGSISNDTIYIRWDDGDPDAEELTVVAQYQYRVFSSTLKWVESGTSNEWYLVLSADDGDPSVTEPDSLTVNGEDYSSGTVGSLSSNEYGYDDNDSLGFDTIYVYSTTDPNGSTGTGLLDETQAKIIVSEDTDDSFSYYIIDHIVDDTSFSVYGNVETTFSNAPVTFYYNHNPFNSGYKLNIQAYTSGLLYNSPTINDNRNEEDICGPFYVPISKSDWGYGGDIFTDYNFEGTGVLFEKQDSLATNGASYIQIFPTIDDAGDLGQPAAGFLGITYLLGSDNQWTKKDFVEDLTVTDVLGSDVYLKALNSIQNVSEHYICTAQIEYENVAPTFDGVYPGIAFSTDVYGLEWKVLGTSNSYKWASEDGTTRAATDNQAICAAANTWSTDLALSRTVALFWRPSDNRITIQYSDDGENWGDAVIDGGGTTFTGNEYCKVRYINDQFVITKNTGVLYGDGTTFTTKTITGSSAIRDIAFNDDGLFIVVENDFTTWYCSTISGTWTEVALPISLPNEETNYIIYDSVGERFVVNSDSSVFWSVDGINWITRPVGYFGNSMGVKHPTNMIQDQGGIISTLFDGGASYLQNLSLVRFSDSVLGMGDFVPISDIYRASTFSVLDGYTVLMGTREYDSTSGEWTYYPRRIRWTAPSTYNDFSSTGSGTGDLNGEGAMIDSRSVNGRIVTFETSRMGALVPRGDVDDPWDYDVIKEDFGIISNPITIDDFCYVIGTSGLVYATDGIQVTEVGSSFDATKFDDFTENKPIKLEYSQQLNSLIAYYFDQSASTNYAYFIGLSEGAVTKVKLPRLTDDGGLSESPRFITCVSNSPDKRIIVSHHPKSSSSDIINTCSLSTGNQIIGVDAPTYGSITDNSYWHGILETGEIYLAPEGEKTSLKHIIVRTYSEADGTNTDRPRIIAQIKSLGHDEWHTLGKTDQYSTYTITTSAALPGDYTDEIKQSAASITQLWVTHSGATTSYTINSSELPGGINANDCAIFTEDGGVYTQIKSPEIFGTDVIVRDVEDGTSIYVSWNNSPEIVVKSGDFYDSSLGFIRVTGVSGAMSSDGAAPTFDRYLSSGYEDISTHYPSAQIPDGEGETKIGVNKLLDGFKLKLIVVPEYGGAAAPSIVKITGISLGHIPMGRKILQATGE